MTKKRFWWGRIGFHNLHPLKGRPRFWFHAASVGEINGAVAPIIEVRRLYPKALIVLTVGTFHGFRFALSRFPPEVCVLPFPLDLPLVADRALRFIEPDLFVGFESEYWPYLSGLLRAHGIPTIQLNARLSDRSASLYSKLKPLFSPIFKHFSYFAAKTEADYRNAIKMGVCPEKAMVLGSSKYDSLAARAASAKIHLWRDSLALASDDPVIVGGSLRGEECLDLLRIFCRLRKNYPDLLGIFAPRHLGNIEVMRKWLDSRSLAYDLLSTLISGRRTRSSQIVLVDLMGVLFDLYALGDLIFCGGTLVPVGGHNIVEPVVWGKVVFYGPHVDKVIQEHKILESLGLGVKVENTGELYSRWLDILRGDGLKVLKSREMVASEAIKRLGGVVSKQIELIENVVTRICPGGP